MKKVRYFLPVFLVFIFIICFNGLRAQTNVSVTTATLVNTFPYTEADVNSSNGGTATGMNGACSSLTCCSTLVYRVEISSYGSLRVDNSNFTTLAGFIIAYTPDIDNPQDWSDLTYWAEPGNFCGFKDSLQMGSSYNWSSGLWMGSPDINNPSEVVPPGTYFVLLSNHNAQSGQGANSDFTFQFIQFCPDGGDTIYVDKTASGNNDGSSFVNAYNSLHDALDNVSACDQIWVSKGTYIPSQESDGSTDSSRDFTFSIPSGIELYGGFAGTETELSQRVNYGSGEVNETILSGDINEDDNGSTNTTWDNTYAVVSSTSNLNDITTTGSNPANRYFVKGDASGTNDGSSWTNAYTSLQSALDVAVSDDEVWVAKGTYYPSQETDGTTDTQRKFSFQMVEGVTIYGGFAGTESATTERTDYGNGETNETILSGDFNDDDVITGSGATLVISGNSENSYHIFDHPSGHSLSSSAILDGFTLSGGNANGSANPWNDAGAIYNQSGQSPTINNCYFTGNRVSDNGGAIFNANSANANITNCTFALNYATDAGGAMGNYDSDVTITNCLFYGNRAKDEKGGAIYNYSASNPVLTNCTFTENSSVSGGGVYNTDNSDITIVNCIVYGNTITSGVGSQIRNYTNSNLTLSYSDIEGGISGGIYSSSSGSTIDGGDNIDSAPKFVGSTLNANHPYSIYGDSPCTDVGSDAANSESYDIRGTGFDRKLSKTDGTSGTIDIGAYEYKFNSDPTNSGRYYVDIDATGNNNGSTWINAFTSFQSALDVAVSDDEIWVVSGTYKPSSSYDLTNTARYYHFRMIDGVEIYGGFGGTETSTSQRADFGDGGTNETILSGDIGTVDDNSDNCYHLFYHLSGLNLTNTAVLDGFTITDGNANSTPEHHSGGGMLCDGSSPLIRNCSFINNTSSSNGGAIYLDDCTAFKLVGSTVANNSTESYGGGIAMKLTDLSIINCLVAENTADLGAGGINMDDCTASIINSTIVENNAVSGTGDAMSLGEDEVSIVMKNSIVWGTNSISLAEDLIDVGGATLTTSYSNIQSSGGSSSWDSDFGTDGGNNIDADPEFVGSSVNSSHPYSIYGVSPCADVGNSSDCSETYDIRGSDYGRKLSKTNGTAGTIDIGAYEYKYGTDCYISPIYVDYDKSGDGSSWAGAFASLQSALDEAVDGQEIWVAKGTYNPSYAYDLTNTSRYYHFRMINGVSIYGGFAGTETETSQRTDYSLGETNETILSGDFNNDDIISGSGSTLSISNNSENCYHVFYHPSGTNLTTDAVLDGFTISGGYGDTYPNYYGAGMYNLNSSPSINDCIFIGNDCHDGYGAGMYNKTSSSPSITNCTFSKNIAKYGGGINNDNSSPNVANCNFSGNSASFYGGGINNSSSSSPSVTNCNFTANHAGQGGGIFSRESNPTVTNCTFFSNSATYKGGGMNMNICSPTLINCTFSQNTAADGGGIYLSFSSSTPSISNTIFWNNTASNSGNEIYNYSSSNPTFYYCDIKGSGGSSSWDTELGTDGGNNIDSDPNFADAGGDDFRLSSYSPCADVGDNSVNSETNDIRGSGYNRKLNKTTGASGTIDMGAYEFLTGTDPEYASTTWAGTSSTAWITEGNWSGSNTPTIYYNITVPDVANDPVIATDASASCNNLTIDNGATLTIQSTVTGTGSLIANGNITNNGTITAQRYSTAGVWHGISAPLSGTTANTYYLDGNPNVWLKEHDESTNAYTYLTSLSTPLSEMKGFFIWLEGSTAKTFDYVGGLLEGEAGSDNNLVRSASGTSKGWNYVGNPFTSAIDWNASSGWTKTNVDGTIYVYNSPNWATWNGSTGTNGGTQYIASGQGFFVSVTDDGSTQGTLKMDDGVKVHNSVSFLKQSERTSDNLIRLKVSGNNFKDETVICLREQATTGFDADFDAHKLFSFNTDAPQIYSTANDFMAINSLPISTSEIPVDVRGADNMEMTISLSENDGLGNIYLRDNYTGTQTNLINSDYSFMYDAEITDRFTVYFTAVGLTDLNMETFRIYAYNKAINVIVPEGQNAEIYVYNLTGQKIVHTKTQVGINKIPLSNIGYYVVKVVSNSSISSKKVFIK